MRMSGLMMRMRTWRESNRVRMMLCQDGMLRGSGMLHQMSVSDARRCDRDVTRTRWKPLRRRTGDGVTAGRHMHLRLRLHRRYHVRLMWNGLLRGCDGGRRGRSQRRCSHVWRDSDRDCCERGVTENTRPLKRNTQEHFNSISHQNASLTYLHCAEQAST